MNSTSLITRSRWLALVGLFLSLQSVNAAEVDSKLPRTVVQRGIESSPNDSGDRFFAASADRRVVLLGWAWEIWAYDLASRKVMHRARLAGGHNLRATIDPTGRYFLIGRNMGHGWHPYAVHDLVSGREIIADPDEEDRASVRASEFDASDARVFAFQPEQVSFRDPDSGQRVTLPLVAKNILQEDLEISIDAHLSLSWDGHNVLTLKGGGRTVDQFTLEGETGLSLLHSCGGHFASPDRLLAYGGDGQEVLVFDVFRHRVIFRKPAANFTVDPTSNRIALELDDGRIEIYDLSAGKGNPQIASATGSTPVIFSRGGKFLASWNAHRKVVSHHDLESGRVVELAWPCEDPDFDRPLSLAYHDDGRSLAAAGSHVCQISPRVFETATGRVRTEVEGTMAPTAFDAASGRFFFTVFDSHTTMGLGRLFGEMDRWQAFPGEFLIVPNSYVMSGLSFDSVGGIYVADAWNSELGAALVSYSAADPSSELKEQWRVPGEFFGAVTTSGERAFVAERSGGLFVFDPSRPEDPDKQIHVYLFSDGSLSAVNGRGEYFIKPQLAKMLGFAFGNRAYSFEQFDLQLNRPERIFSALKAPEQHVNALNAWRRERMRRSNLDPDSEIGADLSRLPTCEILDRGDVPLTTSASVVPLRVRVEAGPKTSIEGVQIYVNNVPGEYLQIAPLSNGQATIDLSVALSTGRNKVEISALSSDGLESIRSIVYCHSEPAEVRPPRLFVLAVGVSDYANDELDLAVAHKDAIDLVRVLQEVAQRNFSEVRVETLLNHSVTRESVVQAGQFLRQADVNDQVIVFFAGHGFQDEGDLSYWFGTSDIDPVSFQERGLPYWEIERLFDGVAARQRLLLMDTCYSGEAQDLGKIEADIERLNQAGVTVHTPKLAVNRTATATDSINRLGFDGASLFADLRRTTGASVLTATSGVEFVFALEKQDVGNGIFTYAFLNGLKNLSADFDGDGLVRTSEMDSYLVREVSRLTDGAQQTSRRSVNLETDIAIAASSAPVASTSAQSSAVGATELTEGRWQVIEQVTAANGGYRILWEYEIFQTSDRRFTAIGFKSEIDGKPANRSEKLAVSILDFGIVDGGTVTGYGRESNGRGTQFITELAGRLTDAGRSFEVDGIDVETGKKSAVLSGRLLATEATGPQAPSLVDGEWTLREIVAPENGGWDIEWQFIVRHEASGIEGRGTKSRVNGKEATAGEKRSVLSLFLSPVTEARHLLEGQAAEQNSRGQILRSDLRGARSADGRMLFLETFEGNQRTGVFVGWKN